MVGVENSDNQEDFTDEDAGLRRKSEFAKQLRSRLSNPLVSDPLSIDLTGLLSKVDDINEAITELKQATSNPTGLLEDPAIKKLQDELESLKTKSREHETHAALYKKELDVRKDMEIEIHSRVNANSSTIFGAMDKVVLMIKPPPEPAPALPKQPPSKEPSEYDQLNKEVKQHEIKMKLQEKMDDAKEKAISKRHKAELLRIQQQYQKAALS